MTQELTIALNLFAAFAGFSAAVLALRLSRAPGWRELGPAALVAAAGAAVGLSAIALADERAVAIAPVLTQLRLALGAAGVAAWMVYADRDLGSRRPRLQRLLVGSALVAGAIALVPGLTFNPPVVARVLPAFGVTYRDPTPTLAAALLEGWLLLLFAMVTLRYALAAVRLRDPSAAAQAVAFAVLLTAALNDVLAVAGLLSTPYVLGLAAFPPVGVSTFRLARRFGREATALVDLRKGLERVAEQQAQELVDADEELEAAARLARLGRVAAGIGRALIEPVERAEAATARALWALERGDVHGASSAVGEALAAAKRLGEAVRSPLRGGPADLK